jgi:hypothetical protein
MTTRRSKTSKAKGRKTTRLTARSSEAADLRKQLHQRAGELAHTRRLLAEALQQQTASADVLRVISSSIFDLKAVLAALIESATWLCGATRGHVFQFDGEFLRFVAAHGAWPGFTEYLNQHPIRPGPGSVAGKAAAEHRTVHVHDVLEDPDYELGGLVRQQGYRTVLAVPMLREQALLGVLTILKTQVEPFTEKQIELVSSFASQAVIAIENARLFEEVQTKTRDLEESLQQQTATSEILAAISISPGELAPLFLRILENAVRVCGAKFGTLDLYDGERFDVVASYNLPREYAETQLNKPFVPHPKSGLGTIAVTHRPVHIEDLRTMPGLPRTKSSCCCALGNRWSAYSRHCTYAQ